MRHDIAQLRSSLTSSKLNGAGKRKKEETKTVEEIVTARKFLLSTFFPFSLQLISTMKHATLHNNNECGCGEEISQLTISWDLLLSPFHSGSSITVMSRVISGNIENEAKKKKVKLWCWDRKSFPFSFITFFSSLFEPFPSLLISSSVEATFFFFHILCRLVDFISVVSSVLAMMMTMTG